MKYTLALQTAEYPNSIALLDLEGKVLDERVIETREKSEKILPDLTEAIFEKNNIEIKDVEKVVVCLGPGSYTGLRVGVAFAKGLAQFGEIKIVGVDDFDVLEEMIGTKGIILIDAKNERVYYKVGDKIKVDYLEKALEEIKPSKGTKFFGSGAVVNESYLDGKYGKDVVSDNDKDHVLTAAIAGMASKKGEEVSSFKVKPIYVQEARITESKKS